MFGQAFSSVPLCLLITVVASKNISYLNRKLFDNYEPSIAPINDKNEAICVKLKITFKYVQQVLQLQNAFVLQMYLQLQWYDIQLEWDPASYAGISYISKTQYSVWTPDISFWYNDLFSEIVDMAATTPRAIISNQGIVTMGAECRVSVMNKMNIVKFPFDVQHAKFYLGPLITPNSVFVLQLEAWEQAKEDARIDDPEWTATFLGCGTLVAQYERGDYNVTFCDIELKRNPHYYIYHFCMPSLMVTALALAGLQTRSMGSSAQSEKYRIGLTTLLSETVLTLSLADSMPKTSQSLSVLGIFYIVLMGITASATICASVSVWLEERGKQSLPIPGCLRRLYRFRKHRKDSECTDNNNHSQKLLNCARFSIDMIETVLARQENPTVLTDIVGHLRQVYGKCIEMEQQEMNHKLKLIERKLFWFALGDQFENLTTFLNVSCTIAITGWFFSHWK